MKTRMGKKSKRVSAGKRYSVEKKVRRVQAQRKRDERRKSRKSPDARRKLRKDPGIPNLWPWKEDLLQSMEVQRAKIIEERQRKAESNKAPRSPASQGGSSSSSASSQESQQQAGRAQTPLGAPQAALALASAGPRIVAHIDLDCFYVSVALRDNPGLRGHPVAVIPAKNVTGTSEVASASYEARKYGIKARMLVREAKALCPDLIVKTAEFDKYEQASGTFYDILWKHTSVVEPVSADEAYVDLTLHGDDPLRTMAAIREDVAAHIGITASAGIGGSMLVARLATDAAKPDGLRMVSAEEVESFLAPLPVASLPGVGRANTEKLSGIVMGPKVGELLFDFARGVDRRDLKLQHSRKSVGTQISWGIRYETEEQLAQFIADMAAEVSGRLRQISARGKGLHITVGKHRQQHQESEKYLNPGEVETVRRSVLLANPTDDPAVLGAEFVKLFRTMHVLPCEGYRKNVSCIKQQSIDTIKQLCIALDPFAVLMEKFLMKVPPSCSAPLVVAAQNGHTEVARLLGRGARVDGTDAVVDTPLFLASQNGHLDTLGCLPSTGACPKATRNASS
eukprot:m51a1_g7235 putative dna repair protein rev1-like (567) ;mRNA; r:68600-76061